jgi:hypothetical protein
MTVYRNDRRWDASNVELQGGEIHRYSKKDKSPEMRHIDYGLGILSADALAGTAEDQPLDLAVLYQSLLARGQLAAWEMFDRFYEIGSFEGLRELTQLLGKNRLKEERHAIH